MLPITVMLVEADSRIAREKETALSEFAIATILTDNTPVTIELAALHRPDVIVAASVVPPNGAMDLCRQLQDEPQLGGCPLIVYARQTDPLEAALLLETGVADYVPLHVSGRELAARVRRVVRAAVPEYRNRVVHVGELTVDGESCAVICNGRDVGMTATEFKILQGLTCSLGVVLSRERIARIAGVDHFTATDRTVDTHIKNIRRKLGGYAASLQTVRGFGYRLRIPA